MREHEMRLRVFRFLKARMRNMIMPATVGLGLAVGGCTDPVPVYGTPPSKDAPTQPGEVARDDAAAVPPDLADDPSPDRMAVDTRDSAASPDDLVALGRDSAMVDDVSPLPGFDALPVDRPVYGVPNPDGAFVPETGKIDATAAIDASSDLGAIIAKYIAPIPDAGPELPLAQPDYMAQMPDSGPAVRYMALMPDAAADTRLGVLYMAPAQS